MMSFYFKHHREINSAVQELKPDCIGKMIAQGKEYDTGILKVIDMQFLNKKWKLHGERT